MARSPFSAPVPRVPRSRRDDRYGAGHPTFPKRASAGYVVSIQDAYDTVTVDVLDEQLTGVIPLGEMPPVGAIVEVESRGDLLVIPTWYEGPEPCTTATLTFSNYRSAGTGTPTPTKVGTDPWGDTDGSTNTQSQINRYSISSGDGYHWYSDLAFPGGFPAGYTVTEATFEADIVATNGGAAGSELRSGFIFYGAPSLPGNTDGAYLGEFSNYPLGTVHYGIQGTGTVTGTWVDSTGEGTSMADIPQVFAGGYFRVGRYNNLVSPFTGTYALTCSRIAITLTVCPPAGT